LGIAATVATSYGQGVISFDNYENPNNAFDVPVTWSTGGEVASGVISLWVGTGVVASSSLLTEIATTPLFSASGHNGWYDMSVSGVGLGYAQIPASIWSGSQTLTFQARGTSGSFTGATTLWQELPDTAGGSIDPVSPNEMINGPAPLVIIVPEPSTLALAGLGAAALLALRRRQ